MKSFIPKCSIHLQKTVTTLKSLADMKHQMQRQFDIECVFSVEITLQVLGWPISITHKHTESSL